VLWSLIGKALTFKFPSEKNFNLVEEAGLGLGLEG